ncbi:MAG TPA: VWA domain-containing protein [Thermomicrobiales bacterium]|nr:VWA domain-containing protein [Thermomicrobiales bacterium]
MSLPQFLIPAGLMALVAVPVVIFLHMRNTTPVQRPVPTLRFWFEAAREQTEQTRFRRPPLTLLLLLHLLITALLALGLARPVATGAFGNLGLRTEPRHAIILLDGSTSMTARDPVTGESRFAAARAAALTELDDLRQGDVATVLVLGTRTLTLEGTDPASLATLRDRLATLRPPGGRANLTDALTLAHDLLLPGQEDRVTVITDGAVTADPGVVEALGAPVDLVVIGTSGPDPANVAVTELSARNAPGNTNQQELYARITNFGPETVRVPVVLRTDTIETGRQDATLPPGGRDVELSWRLPAGVRDVEVEILNRDILPDDDRAALILRQESSLALDVLLVSDLPSPLQRALEVLPGARVTTETSDRVTSGISGDYDLVVFERTVPPASLPDAALLFVQPPPDNPFPTTGEMIAPTVVNVAADDPLLRGVDLGGVVFGPTPAYASLDGQSPVVSAEAGPLLFRATVEGRRAVVIAFDVAQSNIRQRVAFPILVANIASELVPSPLPSAVPLGDPLGYRPSAEAATVVIEPPAGETVELTIFGEDPGAAGDALPRQVTFADTGQPGTYAVTERSASGEELAGGRFVVNAGHPAESDLRPTAGLDGVLAAARATSDEGVGVGLNDLWPALVLAALIVLGLEWLLTLWPQRRAVYRGQTAP